jgi:hypothetical protein
MRTTAVLYKEKLIYMFGYVFEGLKKLLVMVFEPNTL